MTATIYPFPVKRSSSNPYRFAAEALVALLLVLMWVAAWWLS